MISYLYFLGEFWLSCAAKEVEWLSESLFLNFRSGGSRRTMSSKRGRYSCGFYLEEEELELGLGSVKLTRSFGSKRILMSSRVCESLSVEIPSPESLETQRSRTIVSSSPEKSPLESLLQELLVKVICRVDHEDLKSLILVSKTIKEASLVAKKDHFAYNTPKKSRRAPENSNWNHREDDDDDIEPPNAPIHKRWSKAKRKEQLKSISVQLFK